MFHIDLFSGIGGFALAAEWSGFETVAFCEIDQYCQKVLTKHWPNVPIYNDVRKLNRDQLERDGIPTTELGILTGGFPCQPFSIAGKQEGRKDQRCLWSEMLRLVSELHPTWVLGENVLGIVNLDDQLDRCLSDLEGQGYTTQAFIIPALAVGAPHRRDRVWIIANSVSARGEVRISGPEHRQERDTKEFVNGDHRQPRWEGESYWSTLANICRVVDGIPSRVDRLRGLGNAVVPQIPYQLMSIIKQLSPNHTGTL